MYICIFKNIFKLIIKIDNNNSNNNNNNNK